MKLTHTHTKYRADIDGLRAIAILSVIAFHAFPLSVKGGFVGVDVFFVISGFLISTILFTDIEAHEFSIGDFYIRRIKRIFPALLLMLFFCLAFGWFALLDYEYQALGKHIAGAAAFISNLIFWQEAGYFDTAAELKPLLHMWSLGIEEQFYFVWPFLIWIIWKKKLNPIAICTFIIGVSFAYSYRLTNTAPIAGFYSPFSRLWELIGGGLLAYLVLRKSAVVEAFKYRKVLQNAASVLGFLLIAIAVKTISKENAFPGWRALLPFFGAVFILLAGPKAFLNRFVLSNKILVWIGLISYPLYLWHWPLLCYARILEGQEPKYLVRLIVIVLSFILSWLTYKFVETPIRLGQNQKLKISLLFFLMLIFGLSGYFVYKAEGIQSRYINQRADNLDLNNANPLFKNPDSNCKEDSRIQEKVKAICKKNNANEVSRPTIVIWGDSSSSAWSHVFLDVGKELNLSVIVFSHASCPPLIGVRKSAFPLPEAKKYCSGLTLGDDIITSIEKIKPAAIFLIGAWNFYAPLDLNDVSEHSMTTEFITTSETEDADRDSTSVALKTQLPKTILALEAISQLVVFRSWPSLYALPNYRVHRVGFLQNFPDKVLKTYTAHRLESKFVDDIFDRMSAAKKVIFLDPSRIVCGEFCDFIVSGRHMYTDSYHVSPQGSILAKDEIIQILKSKGL